MNNIKKGFFCKELFNNKENHSIVPKKYFFGSCDYNHKFLENVNFKNEKKSYFFISESEIYHFLLFCHFLLFLFFSQLDYFFELI